MHNAAFASCGLAMCRYELWPTILDDLAHRMDGIRRDETISGCNVTVPHKVNVLPYLDLVASDARAIGAVNTIVKSGSVLSGHNTDWIGWLADLRAEGFEANHNTDAIVLGAGGSARGIVYALLSVGARVEVVNRDIQRAAKLVGDFVQFGAISVGNLDSPGDLGAANLVVNCTSAGMAPDTTSCAWPVDLSLPSGAFIYDLVYRPPVTGFLRAARAKGLRHANGLGMLVAQGAAAFEMWTSVPAAAVAGVMRVALERALEESSR